MCNQNKNTGKLIKKISILKIKVKKSLFCHKKRQFTKYKIIPGKIQNEINK